MHRLLLTALVGLLLPQSGLAQGKPAKAYEGDMTFKSLDVSAICLDCSVIQVSGEFGDSTMKGYRSLLDQSRLNKNTFFVFDSPGGSLKAAMLLGVSMREKKIHAIIGRAALRNGEVEIEPARCASSCALAFFGGVTRSMTKESRLGVHSWMPLELVDEGEEKPEEERKTATKPKVIDQKIFAQHQRTTGVYLKYLDKMGIDLRVAVLTLQTPYSSIAWVSSKDRSLWSLVTIDSKLSTLSERRWPVIFLKERIAPPLKRDPPGSLKTVDGRKARI